MSDSPSQPLCAPRPGDRRDVRANAAPGGKRQTVRVRAVAGRYASVVAIWPSEPGRGEPYTVELGDLISPETAETAEPTETTAT